MPINLTQKEQDKLDIINQTLNSKLTNGQAATMLGISDRQVKRLKKNVRRDGPAAVIHKLKDKQGNHHIDSETREKAIAVIASKYADFKPTFTTEKLAELHAIHVSYGTTRLWMIEKKLWKPKKHKQKTYRSWRPRKEYFGEMQQFDGSYHHWFENRYCDDYGQSIEVCLLASIDDATGKITKAAFMDNEGVNAVFTFWREYIEQHGKPITIYLDSFSTYKINHKAAVDNKDLITQFERAMQSLGIKLITAHSPQAKGRIERLFQTLQDRLVKEMRLSDIDTPETGNKFLKEVFLPKFNNKFSVATSKEGDVHRTLTPEDKNYLNHIFSIHETRRVNLDFTIQFKNNWYQLTEIQSTTVRPLERVTMETWLDQSIHIVLKNHELNYILLPERPKKPRIKQPIILTTHTLNYKPPSDHPWRRYSKD